LAWQKKYTARLQFF